MRVVIALESNSRIFNRTILGIADRSCNDCRFVTLAMSGRDARRCERNVNAKHPNNSGGDGCHQQVRPTAPVIANLPVRAILSNVILALIYCPSWSNAAFA